MQWQWEPTEKVLYVRGSKILGGCPPRLPPLNVCFAHYVPAAAVLPLPSSPFANILDLLQGRISLKWLPLALHYTV